jgi:peptide/nickel transport system substrate-binding protein
MAAMLRDGLAQDSFMLREGLRVAVAQLLDTVPRALDVGEEKGDAAAWEFGHQPEFCLGFAGQLLYDLPMALRLGRVWIAGAMVTGGVILFAGSALANHNGRTVHKGGTFRIATASLDAIDPATAYGAGSYLSATCAQLVRGADASARIVPEVAAAFPRISPDGRTYTFTLRKGYRFNTGGRVTAASFAHELNRVLNPNLASPYSGYFTDIVGAQDVLDGHASKASGIQAHGYRLVFHLTRPVPDLTARLTLNAACSVPSALPVEPGGIGAPLPAAGPYYIAAYLPGRKLLIKRNRFYHGSRPHRVNKFVVSFVDTEATALAEVKAGQADWSDVSNDVLIEGLSPRERTDKARFFIRPFLGMRYLVMNTSRGIFKNNPRLRRAVNFAIDRSALVRQLGGPLAGRPTNHYLPTSLPGSLNTRIYPLKRPNLKRARALARGHLRGGRVVLYSTDSGWRITQVQIIERDLRKIGIQVQVQEFPPELYFTKIFNLTEPYDLAILGLGPDYPDPYAFLNEMLTGHSLRYPQSFNIARFDSPKYNRLLAHAARLSGPARYRVYGKLDIQLARESAPLAAYMNDNILTYVSKRTGCVIANPFLDLAAVCLK